MKEKNDHRSKFSKLSNWTEEAWKNQDFNGIRTRDLLDTNAMLSKRTSLPMRGFIAQLVEHRTASRRPRVRIPLKPWLFSAFFFSIA